MDAVLLAVGALPERHRGRALARQLQTALRTGAFTSGDTLPGSRVLATAFGVARGTATAALDEMCELGLLIAEPRKGYRVTGIASAAPVPALPRMVPGPPSPGVGDLRLFPRSAWSSSLRHAISALSDADLGYTGAAGLPWLREVIATYLRRVRGAEVDPENVVVVAGVAQAQSLIAAVGRRAGLTRWYVEDPQPPTIRLQLTHHGCELTKLALDAEGAVVDPVTGPGFVLVTPAHQAPTGVAMSIDRKRHLVDRAREVGAYIIEDDYDGDLPLARDRRRVLQAIDPGQVLLTGSVSKTLAPGLRLGWVCAPARWAEAIEMERAQYDHGSPAIEQAALAHFIETGRYDRHLRSVRKVYATRRAALVDALAAVGVGPEAGIPTNADGSVALQLCLRVAPGRTQQARALASSGWPTQVVETPDTTYLVIGVANVSARRAEQLAAGVRPVVVVPGRDRSR